MREVALGACCDKPGDVTSFFNWSRAHDGQSLETSFGDRSKGLTFTELMIPIRRGNGGDMNGDRRGSLDSGGVPFAPGVWGAKVDTESPAAEKSVCEASSSEEEAPEKNESAASPCAVGL